MCLLIEWYKGDNMIIKNIRSTCNTCKCGYLYGSINSMKISDKIATRFYALCVQAQLVF